MKLIVCDTCEASFQIKHFMDENYYKINYCLFCGNDLNEDMEDIMEWEEDED